MPNRRVSTEAEMLGELQRLIEAIDRRVPKLERTAEPKIARDAADLRKKAVALRDALLAAKDARRE